MIRKIAGVDQFCSEDTFPMNADVRASETELFASPLSLRAEPIMALSAMARICFSKPR
jgi:hypothetical protein